MNQISIPVPEQNTKNEIDQLSKDLSKKIIEWVSELKTNAESKEQ